MFTTTWRAAGADADQGSVASGQRGLYYAVHNMRRGVDTAALTHGRVAGQDQKAIYDSAADVDLYPACAWCPGAYCEDISGHYDRLAAEPARPFYYQPDSGGPS